MRAVTKGYQYCISEPEKAAVLLSKQVPDLDPELVRRSMIYLSKEYQAEAPKWGVQNPVVWSSFANWMYHNRLLKNNIIVENAFTNSFVP